MRRTDAAVERQVVNMIAVGDTYSSICAVTGVPVSTIKKIRYRNQEAIERLKVRVFESQAQAVTQIVAQSNRLLLARLTKADSDEQAIADLNERLRTGTISHAEYLRQKRGLKPITIRELLAICSVAHNQIIGAKTNCH